MFFRSKEKKDTIKHYKRMIKWVKKQSPDDSVNSNKMFREIGENWYSPSCSYCKKYLSSNDKPATTECWRCELRSTSVPIRCCNGLWNYMEIACRWKEWILAAKKVLKYIKKYG